MAHAVNGCPLVLAVWRTSLRRARHTSPGRRALRSLCTSQRTRVISGFSRRTREDTSICFILRTRRLWILSNTLSAGVHDGKLHRVAAGVPLILRLLVRKSTAHSG